MVRNVERSNQEAKQIEIVVSLSGWKSHSIKDANAIVMLVHLQEIHVHPEAFNAHRKLFLWKQ